jgi:hypothetical protein
MVELSSCTSGAHACRHNKTITLSLYTHHQLQHLVLILGSIVIDVKGAVVVPGLHEPFSQGIYVSLHL